MPEPLYLHIGRSKTGTSALQRALAAARPELRAAGYCYPLAGAVSSPGEASHTEIALACFPKTSATLEELAALRDRFEDEAGSAPNVVVSSEGFQNVLDRERLDFFFRGGAGKRQIETVCYFREFLDSARSNYAQRVQASDLAAPFEKYCTAAGRWSLDGFLAFWRAFSDRLHIMSYDRAMAESRSIIPGFCRLIGAPEVPDTADQDANPTISGNLLSFKVILNRVTPHKLDYYFALQRIALREPRYSGPFRIADDAAARIRAEYPAHNKILREAFGDLPERSFAKAPPRFDAATWSEDVDLFLAEPEFAAVRDRPEFHAPAEFLAAPARATRFGDGRPFPAL